MENKIKIDWHNTTTQEKGTATFENQHQIKLGRNSTSTTNDIDLSEGHISRSHAHIIFNETIQQFQLENKTSQTTGTVLNGVKIKGEATLKNGDIIEINPYQIRVTLFQVVEEETTTVVNIEELETTDINNVFITETTDIEALVNEQAKPKDSNDLPVPPKPKPSGAFIPSFFNKQKVSLSDINRSNYTVLETTYLAIGGGIGSFVWVDHLRIYGVPTHQIKVLGLHNRPFAKYERLCKNSQIPHHERLRSNSESCPDNIWGFPGYALREFYKGQGIKGLLQVFGEPTTAETYTPRAGDVFESVEKEANRIGWENMFNYGKVSAIRKTDDGRYAIAFTKSAKDSKNENRAYIAIAKYVHLCTGYAGTCLLNDLQDYRKKYRDFDRVKNAYEKHDHIYEDLEKNGGKVIIRGRGIVASRIIQRLHEARKNTGANIQVLHLMRSEKTKGSKYGSSKRAVEHHWEFQPFNWNKACWGGELRKVFENADDKTRSELIKTWGGTTTADRKDWMQIINLGLQEKWYQIFFGDVVSVEPKQGEGVTTNINLKNSIAESTQLVTDYIIDCTGLINDVSLDPMLKDFIDHNGIEQNKAYRGDKFRLSGIKVSNDFEITTMRNGNGKMYAAGAITFNGPYAPVDSFLGLQYCALRSVEHLVQHKAEEIRKLSPLSSFAQWRKWTKGEKPN